VTAQDTEAIRFSAHALTGSARSLGAKALAEACHGLDAMGRRGELADAPRLRERVGAEWERLRDLLRKYLDRLAA
jgi:HPt (histidine-containing phosphotransfer) domain-containing protein